MKKMQLNAIYHSLHELIITARYHSLLKIYDMLNKSKKYSSNLSKYIGCIMIIRAIVMLTTTLREWESGRRTLISVPRSVSPIRVVMNATAFLLQKFTVISLYYYS